MTRITPAGLGNTNTPTSTLVTHQAVMNYVQGCIIRERNRIVKILREKSWIVKDTEGPIDIEKSIDTLAIAMESTHDDEYIFQWRGPSVK